MRPLRGWAARAAGIGCALALAGCTGVALERAETPLTFAPARTVFQAAGRLSVRHGVDALAANFHWHHDGDRDELDLASPLGQTIARLSGGPGGVALSTADGRLVTAADWPELTARALEWALPVDGLAFWIQGVPRSGAPFAVEPAPGGGPSVLRQDGWTIVYQAFAPDPAGVSRPARMTLSYPDVELRLAVDTWQ
jgi:outer membrane lipoprotein LolB